MTSLRMGGIQGLVRLPRKSKYHRSSCTSSSIRRVIISRSKPKMRLVAAVRSHGLGLTRPSTRFTRCGVLTESIDDIQKTIYIQNKFQRMALIDGGHLSFTCLASCFFPYWRQPQKFLRSLNTTTATAAASPDTPAAARASA